MKQTIGRLIPLAVWVVFMGTATLGGILALASLLAGYEENARNTAIIPVNFIPVTVLLLGRAAIRGR